MIRGVELSEIQLPMREEFRSGAGVRKERRVLLVRVVGEDGEEGWGECVAGEDPSYTYETTDTAWEMLSRFVLPGLPGREILAPDEILGPVRWVRGHPMAKATVEMAMWDLQAKELGVPLWELLGGSGKAVPVGVSLGLEPDDDALLRRVEEYLSRGYTRIKLKIAPGRDVAMMRAVCDRFPDAPLSVDANGGYSLEDEARLRELDDLGLLMVEQPLGHEDLRDHAQLQSRLRTPICLDESIRSPGDARLALELEACRVVNIKPGRVGGHGPAREIHDLCRAAGIPVWCGGMLETGIGRAHNIALATLPGFALPGDVSESRRYWDRDIVHPEFEMEGGRMGPPAGAGIGVEPDRLRIANLTVRSVAFGLPGS
ncbi:MAG: o-succinylbenzoate synthase [Gemmatimonadetes bacterium]|nr:o-succinylbenzoate synthase [Gemmatimonadota bacterium]